MQTFGQLSPHSGERLHSSDDEAASNDRLGEGFRMPAITGCASGHGAGVRKPPMHEPAGCGGGLWGFEFLLCCGDGETGSALAWAGTC